MPGTTSTGSKSLGTLCPPSAEQEDEHFTLPQALVLCSLPDDSHWHDAFLAKLLSIPELLSTPMPTGSRQVPPVVTLIQQTAAVFSPSNFFLCQQK